MADYTADSDWIDCHALRRDEEARGVGQREREQDSDSVNAWQPRGLVLIEPDGTETLVPFDGAGPDANAAAETEAQRKIEQEAAQRAAAEEKARKEAVARAKAEAEAKAKAAAEKEAKEEAERKAKAEAERKAKEEAKKKAEAEAKAKEEAEARAQAEAAARKRAEAKAKAEAEKKAKAEAEAKAKAEAEAKAKAEEEARKAAEEKARKEAEEAARKEAERQAKEEAERKAKAEAEAKKKAEEKARREAEAKAKKEAEEKARKEAAAKAAAETKAKQEAERKAKAEAEAKKKAEAKAKKEAEEKARKEAEAKAKKEAEEKARKEAEAEAKAEAKAKAEAEKKAKEEAEAKAKAEAEKKAREEAERKAKEEAEAKAKALAKVDLGKTFRRLIRETGPISLTQYMGESNARYYASRDPLGDEGDFITAPEVSQMFGELIGLWLADLWVKMGSSANIHYVELGPGRGTLASDALRTAGRYGFDPHIHFVEGSPALRKLQLEKFPNAHHHDDLSTLPDDRPLLIVANEFFDALPIHQLVRAAQGWHERMVGLDGDDLVFVAGDKPMDSIVPSGWRNASQGTMIETSPAAATVMGEISQRLVDQGGVALIIDYGPMEHRAGSTLQAIRDHTKVDVLEHPGEADMTAHVDFEMLQEVAKKHGADIMGLQMQGEWLRQLHIETRLEALKRKSPKDADKLQRQFDRLVEDDQMGVLFKVLGICGRRWPFGEGFN